MYSEQGGALNATTNVDRTNYFETLPSTELETALWLESDRLHALNVTHENFENQREVVKEERRQRYDNRPYGTVWENVAGRLWSSGTYHSTTIGSWLISMKRPSRMRELSTLNTTRRIIVR